MTGPSDALTPTLDHAAHDRISIAALAGRDPDLSDTQAAAARALLVACSECARLHADLLALALALPTATTPARPRDFTLTAADAERLRPRGLRRWLTLIGTSRDTITRPLAIGFTTLGLAGLLVATVPGALPGSGDSATLSTVGNAIPAPAAGGASAAPLAPGPAEAPDAFASAAAAAAAAPSTESVQVSAAPSLAEDGSLFSGSDDRDLASQTTKRDLSDTAGAASEDELALRDGPSGWSTLLVPGGLLTIVGLGLFALRWSTRRAGRS